MASAKEYGYFIKGQKLAIIEKDTALDNDVNSRDYGPDVTNVRFKSPQSSVTDGIEIVPVVVAQTKEYGASPPTIVILISPVAAPLQSTVSIFIASINNTSGSVITIDVGV